MRLSQFVDLFVAALYNETQLTGRSQFTIGEVARKYGLQLSPAWGESLFNDYTFSSRVDVHRHIGPPDQQHVFLSSDGYRWVEDELGENVAAFLEQHGAVYDGQDAEQLPEGVANVSGGRVLVGPRGSMDNIPGREGDLLFEYSDDISDPTQLVPASDRLVPLDHNSAPYLEVKLGLAELREELRTSNDLQCAPAERERLLASLSAAQKLWEAAQLKIIQINVGIIITIQDTLDLLTRVGKAVGKSVLVDVIKSIVKHKTGIDL